MMSLFPLLSQVLLDTPGIVPYRYGHKLRLSKAFLSDPSRALLEADMSEWVMRGSHSLPQPGRYQHCLVRSRFVVP